MGLNWRPSPGISPLCQGEGTAVATCEMMKVIGSAPRSLD